MQPETSAAAWTISVERASVSMNRCGRARHQHKLTNLYVIAGDRHWQYASTDPRSGLREFGVGGIRLRRSEQRSARQRAERWKHLLGRDDTREDHMARMSPGTRAEFLLNERGRGDR